MIDVSNKRGSENRGFYGEGASASVLKDQVANDTPVAYYPVGSNIVFQGGATTTVKDALQIRIGQDTILRARTSRIIAATEGESPPCPLPTA